MAINFKSFNQIVSDVIAAVQNYCIGLTDLTPGSPYAAFINVISDNIQYLLQFGAQILSVTRLASSKGADVDSFVGDFGLTRLAATPASGTVVFFRNVASSPTPVSIAPGLQVKTTDGVSTFTVTTDTTNGAWNPTSNAYVAVTGVSTLSLPVTAVTAGTSGNVQANSISLISSSSPFDTVNNPAAFSNATDSETDASLRQRFTNYLNTRPLATLGAVEYAVQSVQQNISYSIVENADANGVAHFGFFSVYVDDGTGAPSSTLLNLVRVAVDAVRPLSVTYSVQPCSVVSASIQVTISAATGYNHDDLTPLVSTALQGYVNTLGVGSPVIFFNLPSIISGVAGVSQIHSLTLNGGTADIGGGVAQSCHLTSANCVVS
jgi:uncharacterized phage protein gp47/JayE